MISLLLLYCIEEYSVNSKCKFGHAIVFQNDQNHKKNYENFLNDENDATQTLTDLFANNMFLILSYNAKFYIISFVFVFLSYTLKYNNRFAKLGLCT